MIRTKVDVVSGFLGAGKTTFIKKLLGDVIRDEKVVLIENEFGKIAIDGGFLKDSGIEIKEMSQGCICCSLVGDFASSLEEILTEYAPDRIIIEPSGVGKLSDVLKAIQGVEERLNVESNSAVTVVDAKKCRLYHKNFGEFFNNQIQFATTILLSRIDKCSAEDIKSAVETVRSINPTAVIITTALDLLSGEKLMEILESPVDLKTELLAEIKEEHHHHHHDEDEECCGHHYDDDDECEHHHHHHDDDDAECEHHHSHDDGDEHEHHHHHDDECGHHHHDDDGDEHEHHHHDDDDDECEHHHSHDDGDEHEHHHHHDDDDECEHHHHHHHGHHHHHADEVFESWGKENAAPISREKLETILQKLADTTEYGDVIRAKGMLPGDGAAGEWWYFDVVPGEVRIRTGEPDVTGKLCVIGPDLKEEKLEEAFE